MSHAPMHEPFRPRFVFHPNPAHPPSRGLRVKRPPNLVASPYSRNYGIACTWSLHAPGWRRNRNSTQMLGVMPETVMGFGTMNDPTYKSWATMAKANRIRGSAVASYQ